MVGHGRPSRNTEIADAQYEDGFGIICAASAIVATSRATDVLLNYIVRIPCRDANFLEHRGIGSPWHMSCAPSHS
jgi:hypothetical protein